MSSPSNSEPGNLTLSAPVVPPPPPPSTPPPPVATDSAWGVAGQFILPLFALVLVLALTLLFWRFELRDERSKVQHLTAVLGEQLALRFEHAVSDRLYPLRAIRRERLAGRIVSAEDFDYAMSSAGQQMSGYGLLAWVDGDGVCRAVAPRQGHEGMLGRSVLDEPQWRALFQQVRTTQSEASSVLADDPTQAPSFYVGLPLMPGAAGGGMLLAELDISTFVRQAVDRETAQSLLLRLADPEHRLLPLDPGGAAGGPAVTTRIHILDRNWSLLAEPRIAFAQANIGPAPGWILWGGIVLSLLVSAAIFQPLRHRRLDLLRTRKHLAALESLNEISASISGRLGAGTEVLDQLAEASRQLLHMDRAGIALFDASSQMLELVASAGHMATGAQRLFALRDMPACQRAIETRQVVDVQDIRDWCLPHNPGVVEQYDARSFLIIPLLVENRMGLLALSSSQPTIFSDGDRRLAQLLGSQAAVILANNRLYELMSDALQAQQKLLKQRDLLAAVNAALYQARTLDQTLQKLVALAPAALGVNVCGVTLATENPSQVLLAAITEPYNRTLAGYRFARHDSNGEILRRTHQMLVLEDAASDPRVLKAVRDVLQVGAIVYLPLLRDGGEMFGTLVLINHKPGSFSAGQLDLAQVFSARAAAAIENARLYQQTRRDAETKAMLLRELNHRVKNSLAGIVGLLSMGAPDLPPQSRHWLDRVIERISLMARAHELFSGGAERIELRELVHQVLSGLSVIHSPHVSIQTDLDNVHVQLNTDRAVSLAMVLHELCHNAIVHGLRSGGTLTLRARALANSRMAVDIIDQPGNPAAADEAEAQEADMHEAGVHEADADSAALNASTPQSGNTTRTGFGLELVNGLVGRELGGHFSLRQRHEGGSVATVEFPVQGDETQEITL